MSSQGDYDAPAAQFDPVDVARVLVHLNRCHQIENLQLARVADGAVTRAWMAGLDADGVDFVAESMSGPRVLRLAFGWPADTLAAAGEELRRLHRTACRSRR